MSNSKQEKVNKKSDKIRGDVIAIVIILAIILGYVFYECYSATHVDVETITAVTSTVYDTIDTQALVIRDEHIINSNSSGITVPAVKDGEKVKLGGDVAMLFSSQENARAYNTAQDLNNQLKYYIDLESKSAGLATDVASIDKDILDDVNSYVRVINSSDSTNITDYGDELNDKFARRQMIIGETIDFSQVKSDLRSQINAIDIRACKPTGYVTADESGIFSSYTDGLEGKFDYKNVTQLDVKTLKSNIDSVKAKQDNNKNLGKLITSYEWYFCCVVPADRLKNINDGDMLDVALKSSDQVFRCQIVSGADVDFGVKETVLVLRCSDMNANVASMRLESIEIRYKEYSGFKVPSSAIHVNDEGKKCVYALISNQVAERQCDIVYSTKDYAIFAYEPENSRSIRYYDQIITKGKDLHDGKIYS